MEVKINIVQEGRSNFKEFSKLEDARDYLIKITPNTMEETQTPVVDTPEEEVAPAEEASETVESETEEVKEEATS